MYVAGFDLGVRPIGDLIEGPEGGEEGGSIVAYGTPESLAKSKGHTGRYLGGLVRGRKKRQL